MLQFQEIEERAAAVKNLVIEEQASTPIVTHDKSMDRSMRSEESKNCSDHNSLNQLSCISYQEDEFEVTRFIDSSVSEEFLNETPVKQIGSSSGQKIILGSYQEDFYYEN